MRWSIPVGTQGPHPAAAGNLSCLHTVKPFYWEHIPAQNVAETGTAVEVIPGTVHGLGWVVPQHGIPPPAGPDPDWLSSARPAPLPAAAQSQRTGAVTPAPLHPQMGYRFDTLSFAWEGWETAVQKRDRGKKKPRKINCRQYLIDTASGAGTVIQATRRGGRKAPALGVARYFHRYCPCSPASGHHHGAFGRATRAFFCFCRFARSLVTARPRNHPRDAASAGMLLREDGDRAARASPCPDLIRNAGPAAAAARAGPYAQLAPAAC